MANISASRPGLPVPQASLPAGRSGLSTPRVLRMALIAAGVVLLIWLLSDVVLLVFMAALLGAILRGLSDWVRKHVHIPEMWALALVTITVLALIIGLFYWSGPRFVKEGVQLWHQVSGQVNRLRAEYGDVLLGGQAGAGSGAGSTVARSAATVATTGFSFIAALFVLVVTAIYFAISPGMYVTGIVALTPKWYRPRAREIILDMGHTLQWWMIGQAIDMLVVGVLAGVGLWLLGVPLFLTLGVIAGLLTFIPYFGAILAGIPGVLMALTVGWRTALWAVVVFLICHAVEGYIVAPVVQKRTVDLPPALTIIGMTIMGTVFGPLGIIMGTPLTAVLLVLVREAYVHDVLGDDTTPSPSVAEKAR